MIKKIPLVVIIFTTFFFFLVESARADDTPLVLSVNSDPTTVPFGYQASISWVLQASTDQSFTFFCPEGVIVKDLNNTTLPCNVSTPVPLNNTRSTALTFVNSTNSQKNITIRITPKDASGVDYPSGAKNLYIDIGTIPQPITNFTHSVSNIQSGGSIVLTWTGVGIGGTNFQIPCVDGLSFSSLSPSVAENLPCNKTTYASGQGTSGSITLSITNTNIATTSATIGIMPMVSVGSYDATRSISLGIEIGPKPKPLSVSVQNFNSTRSSLTSGEGAIFFWNISNATSTNIQFTCSNEITETLIVGTTTEALPCNKMAFLSPLSASTSINVMFANNGTSPQAITTTLFPQNSDGTYNGATSKQLSIIVNPQEKNLTSQNKTTTVTTPTTSSQTSATTKSQPYKFISYLSLGSKGKEVTALQQFFVNNPNQYKGQTVTGYFGPQTASSVKIFQKLYNIAKVGDAGYGAVGPKTRAKLNSLY